MSSVILIYAMQVVIKRFRKNTKPLFLDKEVTKSKIILTKKKNISKDGVTPILK